MTDKGRRRLIGSAVIGISISWKAVKAFSCRRTKNDRPSFPFRNRELLSSIVFASKQQFRTWTSAAKSGCGDKRKERGKEEPFVIRFRQLHGLPWSRSVNNYLFPSPDLPHVEEARKKSYVQKSKALMMIIRVEKDD